MKILPKRKSIRLKNFDYTSLGYYFITICTQKMKCLFGNITDGKMVLNNSGKMIKNIWQSLPNHHLVELDIFQIMPNHIHFILVILPPRRRGIACNARNIACNARNNNDAGFARKTPTTTFGNVTAGSLSCIIRSFKSECTKQIRRSLKNPNMVIWQRNYYEHVIRNNDDLNKIRQYIKNNPKMWNRDRDNPNRIEKFGGYDLGKIKGNLSREEIYDSF